MGAVKKSINIVEVWPEKKRSFINISPEPFDGTYSYWSTITDIDANEILDDDEYASYGEVKYTDYRSSCHL